MKTAYVTVLCNGTDYVPGVEALGRSLEATHAQHERVLMTTPDVPRAAVALLANEGWRIRPIAPIENPNPKTALLYRRFAGTFTKLRAFELEELDKIVFMDADTIALQNIDDLFERPAFAAAPDFFLPDRFNSGVMVIAPDAALFDTMTHALFELESYDGGDQGFLNAFMPEWYAMPVGHRLPAGYNLQHFIYQFLRGHAHLAQRLEREAKVVHYSVQKPWRARSTLTGGSEAWWTAWFGDHPEGAPEWKRQVHHLEDRSFDKLAEWLIG